MGWEVFLPVEFNDRAESKIHELARGLASASFAGGGLMGGVAGLACFHAYYADWTGDLHFEKLAADMLERALNPAAGYFPGLRFSDGMAGLAWTIDHLQSNGLLELDAKDIYDKLDQLLYEAMMLEMKAGHYDYLHGALGYALYFLRNPQGKYYRGYLHNLIDELKRHAVRNNEGTSWLSVLEAEKDLEGVNLGLSHGMASIIIILTMIRKAGIQSDLCGDMIQGGIQYIERQRLEEVKYISCFPSWVQKGKGELQHSRLAWCYGDIGIGMACLSAGIELKNEDHRLMGLNILLKTCERRELQINRVHDAGICHGAAGLALIYNVLYQETRIATFADASLYWLDVCLNMALHDEGIAGYKAWFHPQYGGWKNAPGLLEGAAGIGLVLLSFVSGRDAAWSRSLLLH